MAYSWYWRYPLTSLSIGAIVIVRQQSPLLKHFLAAYMGKLEYISESRWPPLLMTLSQLANKSERVGLECAGWIY